MDSIELNGRFISGRHKGKKITEVILMDVSYVAWCVKNVTWFSLTEDEQRVFDAVVTMCLKYDVKVEGNMKEMCQMVKDRDRLKRLKTPLLWAAGCILKDPEFMGDPVHALVDPYLYPPAKKEEREVRKTGQQDRNRQRGNGYGNNRYQNNRRSNDNRYRQRPTPNRGNRRRSGLLDDDDLFGGWSDDD